jgi:hypothetical protein
MKGRTRLIAVASCLAILLIAGWHFRPMIENWEETPAPPADSGKVAHGSAASAGPTSQVSPTSLQAGRAAIPSTTGVSHAAGGDAQLRLSSPLEPVYTAALNATNAEDRATAFRVAALCVAKQGEIPALTRTDASQITNIPPEQTDTLLAQREDALTRLRAFCATGDSARFLSALKALPQPALGPILRSAHVYRNSQTSDQQQNLQAFTQIFANPERHATQLDAWLDSDAFSALAQQYGLNRQQIRQAGSELLEKLVSDPAIAQLRTWKHCIDELHCNGSRGSDRRVKRAVEEIENNIRTQRWNSLMNS